MLLRTLPRAVGPGVHRLRKNSAPQGNASGRELHSLPRNSMLGAPCLPLLETWETANLNPFAVVLVLALSYPETEPGCPILATFLLLSLGWEAMNAHPTRMRGNASGHDFSRAV